MRKTRLPFIVFQLSSTDQEAKNIAAETALIQLGFINTNDLMRSTAPAMPQTSTAGEFQGLIQHVTPMFSLWPTSTECTVNNFAQTQCSRPTASAAATTPAAAESNATNVPVHAHPGPRLGRNAVYN